MERVLPKSKPYHRKSSVSASETGWIAFWSYYTFSDWFPNLQNVRNICSYEARVEPTLEATRSVLATAEERIDCLDNISEDERREFVAWVMLDQSSGVKQRRSEDFTSTPSFFHEFTKKKSRA